MRILIRMLQGILPLALLGLAGWGAVTMIRNRPVVETQPAQIAPPGVRVHVVTLEDVDLAVFSEGTVRPRTESQLVPEISGRIMSVAPSFAEGGFFEAGDVLVTIDPFDYEQAVISARAQLAQSRLRLAEEEAEAEVAGREWEQLGRGDPRELTLRTPHLEDARAAVAAAEANLVRAERDLERAEIKAPYAGRVRRKNVDVGQFVTVGAAMATIYAVDVAEIRLPLPDEELAYLNLPLAYRGGANRPGPRVTVRTTFAGRTYAWNGRIVRTESEIDPVSRMVHVVAEVPNPYRPGPGPDQPPLAVGMYVDAEIAGRRFERIASVPRAALRGRDQVMVVDEDDRLRFRTIDVLRMTAASIHVREGLSSGDRVVVSTVDSPTEGMLVQVANPGAAPGADADAGSGADPGTADAPDAGNAAGKVAGNAAVEAAAVGNAAADAPPSEPAAERARAERPANAPPPAPQPAAATPASAPAPAGAPAPDLPAAAAPAPAATDPRAVAVLPFTNISDAAAASGLGDALAQGVWERLGAMDTVTVVPAAASARWVIGGAVRQDDDAVQVTARIVETGAGAVVQTVQMDGAASELPRLREAVNTAVAARLADAMGTVTAAASPPPAPAPPAPTPPPLVPAVPPPAPAAPAPAAQAPPPAASGATVAVRPFANLSRDPADDDLASGIGQAVAAHLAGTGTFTVAAAEDGARWVVAGGIQRVGDQIRITARLLEAQAGTVVRSVKVDGPVGDLPRLRDEIAATLTGGLQEMLDAAAANAA